MKFIRRSFKGYCCESVIANIVCKVCEVEFMRQDCKYVIELLEQFANIKLQLNTSFNPFQIQNPSSHPFSRYKSLDSFSLFTVLLLFTNLHFFQEKMCEFAKFHAVSHFFNLNFCKTGFQFMEKCFFKHVILILQWSVEIGKYHDRQ